MTKLATASINSFGPSPEALGQPLDDPVLMVPASEIDHIFKDQIGLYNQLVEVCKDTGILRGRELARLTESHKRALQGEKDPLARMMLVNAYIRQLLTKIRESIKSQPRKAEKVRQAITKIEVRALKIIDHVKTIIEEYPRKTVAVDSKETRAMLAGSGEKVSRKEAIRAMRRAEKLCPALECQHRPNDGRRTMRLTGLAGEIAESLDRISWQQSDSCL